MTSCNHSINQRFLSLGRPWIRGYKPLNNYQRALFDCVVEQLANDSLVDRAVESAITLPAIVPSSFDLDRVLVEAPKIDAVSDEEAEYLVSTRRSLKRNYLAEEAHNRSLGAAGEQFVIEYERYKLTKLVKQELAHRVEHVAETKGNGLGYDVLSFDLDGSEKYIEVKTTSFGKETPFYVSSNELSFSAERKEVFYLYRIFDFRAAPKMFSLCGVISDFCKLDPITYRASF